jgi:multidrug efflux pump subunit AcrB
MQTPPRSALIAWFAHNPVAANLLMLLIVAVGAVSAFQIQRSMFPSFDIEMIFINVAYPGAAPEEVEQGIVLKIEEAINDLDGIKRVESDAFESAARMMIEPQPGVNLSRLLADIQNRVDAIAQFPAAAEKPVISLPELLFPALTLQLSGNIDERSMKSLADEIRRELLTIPAIPAAKVVGARDYEIGIEVSEEKLREYHLTLGDVANIISASSLDLPAGSVRTENGEIMLRTIGQAYVQQDFENILLKTWPDGTRLLLGDIATVADGFVDAAGFAAFNGVYSLGINVFAVGKQDIIDTADAAKAFVAERSARLPDGVTLEVWSDSTYYLKDRLGMMVSSLTMGALLVFLVLALFLEIKLAFWVMMGIPVCFLGAMALIHTPYIDASLDMISIFGFIMVLGIVVDDGIIIGESAYSEQEKYGHSIDSVVNGASRVSSPATFGVLTTIVAFLPSLFIDGVFGAFPEACGWVVILCLAFSIIESKLILPAHIAHSKPATNPLLRGMNRLQESINRKLASFIEQRYQPFMLRCVNYRYTTMTIFTAFLVLCCGLVAGGFVRTILSPEMPGEFLSVELRMSQGVPEERTLQAITEIADAFKQMERNYQRESGTEERLLQHMATYGFDRINGRIDVELTKEDTRSIDAREIQRRWREQVGQVHGAEVFAISSTDGMKFGPSIAFDLMHHDINTLREAAAELEEAMGKYAGVYDVRNGISDTADEFHLELLPEAESLGLTQFDLGTQVRHAFYGAEAQRVQRGIDEIKVMVRYPKADRENVNSLHNMLIRTPEGDEVPIETVARLDVRQGLLKATRINYQRAAEVTAEANKEIVEPDKVIADITRNVMPGLQSKYPELRYTLSGMADEEAKMAKSLIMGFGLALFGIYALLAIPTRSYLQPLIIMGVIPFGIVGAIIGHWVMGYSLSMMSLMGVVALSGVVVNDSLLLVDFINNAVDEGIDRHTAVMESGRKRFRAIMLTSLTTFIGLVPMLMSRSAQAEAMVPMAISLAFGILFTTVITLLLVPCLYMILEDLQHWQEKRARPARALGQS